MQPRIRLFLCHALVAEVDVKAGSKGKEAFRRPLRVTRHTCSQCNESELCDGEVTEWEFRYTEELSTV